MKQGISLSNTRPNSAHQINLPLLPAMAHKPRQCWLYDKVLLLVRICSEHLFSILSTADDSSFYWIHLSMYFPYHTLLLPLAWWLHWFPIFCGSSCYRSAPLSALASGEKLLNILALMFVNQGLKKVIPSHQQLPHNRY